MQVYKGQLLQPDVQMPDVSSCDPHLDRFGFEYRLPHLVESLKRKRKIKIVAIGSSSTAGADGIIPFPCRLELALRQRFYGRMIDVLNRGIGGQEAPEELSRFEPDVIDEAPSLVIWQVGTNAVFRKGDYNPDDVSAAIAAGLNWLAGLPMDVMLMDLQYTRALVDDGNLTCSGKMERRILTAANDAGVNVFRRWALMQSWCGRNNITIENMDDGQKLHLSEWATDCVTNALFRAIEQKVVAEWVT
jgi:acyl-CoA thioesterase-1